VATGSSGGIGLCGGMLFKCSFYLIKYHLLFYQGEKILIAVAEV
jgi:hypothetical protein